MESALTGLLVDWGGVMTTDVFATFGAFCDAEGLSSETLRERFRSDPASRELLVGLEDGSLPEADFELGFAELLGVAPENLIARIFAASRLEPAMVDAVRRARAAGIRTGMISNSWGAGSYDPVLLDELFDATVISAEVRMRKPAPEIYALGAARIGLAPEACVFVDDLGFNLKPAAAIGMAAVRHREPGETIDQLQRLLSVRLR
ncbi:MAG: HAD family phosphatase [Actinomycetota bacterium]|nr:HAD family phosphatase [Actinomycetota bacterium]